MISSTGGMTEEEIGRRWDATVALFDKDGWDSSGVAIVQRATKHFIPGDVVVVAFMNGGGQRQPAWCRTRKGRSVRRLFVEYCNYENDFGDMDGRHARADQHSLFITSTFNMYINTTKMINSRVSIATYSMKLFPTNDLIE